jgi:hypothetical protein
LQGDKSLKPVLDGSQATYNSFKNAVSSPTYTTPGFGCSIAGTIVQAIVFGLTFLPGANEPTLKLATPAQPAV